MNEVAIKPRLYVIWPEDRLNGWKMLKVAWDGIKQFVILAFKHGLPVALMAEVWEPGRSEPQRMTLWMWHGQAAAELTIRTGMRWKKNDVHELVFLEKFMPRRELTDPETGEVKSRPLRTSEATKPQISEAMTAYLAWCYEQGIEVTVPMEVW